MKPGEKTLLTPLRRENRGILTDPQYSGYLPGERYIVFHEYGHPDHLASNTFRTKRAAYEWIIENGGLSDLRGDASGGHLLAEARAYLSKVHSPAVRQA